MLACIQHHQQTIDAGACLAAHSLAWYHGCAMSDVNEDIRRQVYALVDAYRDRCLWFLREDYYPTEAADMLRTLDYIRRYGDLDAFRQAGVLCQWLSANSNKPCANS